MELRHAQIALDELTDENPIWKRNRRAFYNMTPERRAQWWVHAQKMSQEGMPMYVTLVAKVIQLRMR